MQRNDRTGFRDENVVTLLASPRGALRSRLLRRPTTNLLVNRTLREVRSQYRRTALGRIWSLVNPLAKVRFGGGPDRPVRADPTGRPRPPAFFDPAHGSPSGCTYTAKERIEDPSFIVSIEQTEGQTMWAHHTKEADFLPADIAPGPGSVDVVIPRLAFRPGTFHVSGSVHTPDGAPSTTGRETLSGRGTAAGSWGCSGRDAG